MLLIFKDKTSKCGGEIISYGVRVVHKLEDGTWKLPYEIK